MAAPSNFHSPSSPPVLVLAGATAVGKSEVALELAERLGGEIISVDSMQVYRGLDIGTAKPSAAERARVAHHLIDVVEVNEPFDAAQFVQLAHRAVADIQARGRTSILCGGTGLYFKALLEGLGQAPPGPPALRAELEATSLPDLLGELAERDPVTFERIDHRNPRRVIRALEVIRLTGRPFSQQRAPWTQPASPDSGAGGQPREPEGLAGSVSVCIGLTRSAEDLRGRIDLRVDEMFRRGLVAETEQLLQRGLAQNRNALQALGYRQAAEYLQGARSLTETVALVKARTHQFARRQMTWFRRQIQLSWVQLAAGEPAEQTAERLAGALMGRRGPAGGWA